MSRWWDAVSRIGKWADANWVRFLKVTVGIMVVLCAIRLSYEFRRLFFDTGPNGAIDLKNLIDLVGHWINGAPFAGPYPPASHVLLWPFIGWLPLELLRWYWGIMILLMLGWLVFQLEKAAGIQNLLEKCWFRLFCVANYATAVTIGNGQLGIHLLAILLAGIVLLHDNKGFSHKVLAAFLFLLFSLVKPSFTVPFFWVVLFACGAFWVVSSCMVAYIGLTWFSLVFRSEDILTLIKLWSDRVSGISAGYANIYNWTRVPGIEHYSFFFSFFLLGLLGVWVFSRRHSDIWILLGVTAIIARIWTYHQLYDDILILVPVVSLFRISREEMASEKGLDIIAKILIIAAWAGLLAPGTLLRLPNSIGTLFRTGQTLIWAGMLVFLLYWTEITSGTWEKTSPN